MKKWLLCLLLALVVLTAPALAAEVPEELTDALPREASELLRDTDLQDGQGFQSGVTSILDKVSGEIGDDVTAYFAQSEQTPTACALGVLVDTDQSVKVAGGYLIQLLPGAPEEVISRLEQGIAKAGAVTPMLSDGLTPEDILRRVMADFELEFLETTEVCYKCYCSRARVASTLITVGKKDLQEMIDEGKPITIECQFCDTKYQFTPDELRELLASL